MFGQLLKQSHHQLARISSLLFIITHCSSFALFSETDVDAKVEVSSKKINPVSDVKIEIFFCFSNAVFATQISSHDLIATLAWKLHFSFQGHLTLILIKSSSIYMGNVGNPLENTHVHNEQFFLIFIRKMILTKEDLLLRRAQILYLYLVYFYKLEIKLQVNKLAKITKNSWWS